MQLLRLDREYKDLYASLDSLQIVFSYYSSNLIKKLIYDTYLVISTQFYVEYVKTLPIFLFITQFS